MVGRKTKIAFLLAATGALMASEPNDYVPLKIPEGARLIEEARISIPLAHQAKRALLLYQTQAEGKPFCAIEPHQAQELAGAGFKEVEGLKSILIKWSYLEPVDEKGLFMVNTHSPGIYMKDGVFYISSSSIHIGASEAKVVEGVLIVQVSENPKEVIFKFSKMGW